MKTHFLFDKQLSIVLENLPGTLAGVCSSLADAKVNLLALSIADMCDTGELRMVISDSKRAKAVLEERGYDVLESEVLVVEMMNEPGALADIAQRLAKGKVNIEYAYCSAATVKEKEQGKVLGVIKVSDTAKALEILNI
ncbi:MAG: amino acid-binding protein [Candidatus Brocadiales bacterium]